MRLRPRVYHRAGSCWQVAALKSAGAVKVFSEKISGVRTNRPQLSRAIAALDRGDVLAVVRIDPERVWTIARDNLPDLLEAAEKLADVLRKESLLA